MPDVSINEKKVTVSSGATVLDAAKEAGVEIPTMCFLKEHGAFTSCMICVVKDKKSDRLIPSCSAMAVDGMEIETDTEEVYDARRTALELLLSDHVGDCEAPCKRACPAGMNIPLMLRQIAEKKYRDALITVKAHIPLPSVLGRICPAPCEKVCRRKEKDAAVSICTLKQFVADEDIKSSDMFVPTKKESLNKSVVIVGAGPMGVTAAYYLQIAGYDCTIIEEKSAPGGKLRDSILAEVLPLDVLDAEIDVLNKLGVQFKLSTKIGKDFPAEQITKKYDAVILAVGEDGAGEMAGLFGLDSTERGIAVQPNTFQTSNEKVFAGGGAIRPSRMAIKSIGDGGSIALAVDQYLKDTPLIGRKKPFDCKIGRLLDGELDEMMKDAVPSQRQDSLKDPVSAASRCMHCDCRKLEACRLRDYSDQYSAVQRRYDGEDRKHLVRDIHDNVVYEPEKCIKCGICVRITSEKKDELGLTFIGRGFDVRVGTPLDTKLSEALNKTAADCIINCPTGALAEKSI